MSKRLRPPSWPFRARAEVWLWRDTERLLVNNFRKALQLVTAGLGGDRPAGRLSRSVERAVPVFLGNGTGFSMPATRGPRHRRTSAAALGSIVYPLAITVVLVALTPFGKTSKIEARHATIVVLGGAVV